MSSRSKRKRDKRNKMINKTVDQMSDEEVFRVLINDSYYGPRMKATRDGAVIAYIIEEGRADMKKVAGDMEMDIEPYNYPGA